MPNCDHMLCLYNPKLLQWRRKKSNRQQAIIRSSSILKINWKNWKVNWIITFNFKLHCILKETHALNSEKKIECTYYTISVRTCLNCDYRKWQFYTFKRFTTSSYIVLGTLLQNSNLTLLAFWEWLANSYLTLQK